MCAIAQNTPSRVSDESLESLLQRLDNAVEHCEQYRKVREERISALMSALGTAKIWAERNTIISRLCDEYRTYNNDSAIVWLQRGIDAATTAGDMRSANRNRCRLARQYIKAGYYAECQMIIDSVRQYGIEGIEADYYDACGALYGQLEFYTHNARDKKRFKAIALQMNDKVMAFVTPSQQQYFSLLFRQQAGAGQLKEVLATCDAWAKTIKPWTHEFAVVCYNRFSTLDEMGRQDEAIKYLLMAAICDVENATYDGIAIYNISRILKEQGDVKRAQTYIKYAYMSQTRFGGKIRDWAIHDLEDINARYLDQINDKQRIVTVSLVVIGGMFLVLLLLFIYTFMQHRKVKARNAKIRSINRQLTDTNDKLVRLYDQNRAINRSLSEANLIKEGYIGTFFGLCSTYIDQADKTIKKIGKLFRSKNYKELEQVMQMLSMSEDARDGLFDHFDRIFLSIFPNFITDFNALVSPESRIQPKDDTKLTMALRVFALVRLGVDNSQQIATFLGLANSTVYNYRTKYRNEALGDRTTFEERVKEL